jgi:protein-disulfide isomerase
MASSLSRRRVLWSLAAAPALGVALSACSDEGNAVTEAKADETKKVDPVSTGAVQAPEPEGTVDMDKLLQPGALPDKVLGEENAPVTIVEYASMTCPHCAHFDETTFPELKKKYIDTGKVRYMLREFPFDPRAEAGFMLARCSKDNYYPMVHVLFEQQGEWAAVENAKEALLRIAKLAGFTQESFEACLTDQKLLDDIRSVRMRGEKEFGVDATPTFFINGKKYAGAMSIEQMSAIIDGML